MAGDAHPALARDPRLRALAVVGATRALRRVQIRSAHALLTALTVLGCVACDHDDDGPTATAAPAAERTPEPAAAPAPEPAAAPAPEPAAAPAPAGAFSPPPIRDPSARMDGAFFVADGAPDPRACTRDEECTGGWLVDRGGCCAAMEVRAHASGYGTWLSGWQETHCAGAACSFSPELLPHCHEQGRCVSGACVSACP